MCEVREGRIVQSLAGHDKGSLFYTVGEEENFFLLADGKQRKVSGPKRKKRRHTAVLDAVRLEEPITNKRLREVLAVFRKSQGGK